MLSSERKRYCILCKKMFITSYSRKIYCSMGCRNKVYDSRPRFRTRGINMNNKKQPQLTEVQKILEVWKNAIKWYEKELNNLCKKYKVNRNPIEVEEDYIIYEFLNGGTIKVRFDPDQDDELTGNSLKFAERHVMICDRTFSMVLENLYDLGFNHIYDDETYSVYHKDKKEYTVSYYSEKQEDVIVENIE